ncbi:hypothetical protein KY359_04755 [Candidatus Woesearchaeota archaeon]|nr:hypothetical protein [Candidatus Woesearchaeota archaeon]
MKMWMSKRGLSPLIAAVLLIVVVVGIGAVVTGIVRNYVTENKQTITEKASDMKCGVEVAVNVPTVGDELRICNGTAAGYGGSVNFTLENSGSATIDELQVKFFGTNGFDSIDEMSGAGVVAPGTWGSGMEAGATLSFNASYPTGIGVLQQVKIIPRVKVVGRSDKAYCTDAALTFTDFVTC